MTYTLFFFKGRGACTVLRAQSSPWSASAEYTAKHA